jgi:hypothetical protein
MISSLKSIIKTKFNDITINNKSIFKKKKEKDYRVVEELEDILLLFEVLFKNPVPGMY